MQHDEINNIANELLQLVWEALAEQKLEEFDVLRDIAISCATLETECLSRMQEINQRAWARVLHDEPEAMAWD